MSLRFGDYAKDSGPSPDYSGVDGVILNCTPQNYNFRSQLAKAVNDGKLIGYYDWPFAYGSDGNSDGVNCAAALKDCPPGPVFYDIETYQPGQYSFSPADPVALTLAWAQGIRAAGRGAHMYVMGGLLTQFDFSPLVQANIGAWVAQYNSALTVPLGAYAGPGVLGWQWGGTGSVTGGGDGSTFFLDRAGWAAISVPPGVQPDSNNVVPLGGVPVFLAQVPNDPAVYISDGVWYRHIVDGPSLDYLKANNLVSGTILQVPSTDVLGIRADQIPQSIMDFPLVREGSVGNPGPTSPREVLQWWDAAVQGLSNEIKAIAPTLTDAQVQTIVTDLAAKLPPNPTADQIAAAVGAWEKAQWAK